MATNDLNKTISNLVNSRFHMNPQLRETNVQQQAPSILNDLIQSSPVYSRIYSGQNTPQVVFGDVNRNIANQMYGGGGGLEFWPPNEDGSPQFPHPLGGGKTAMEIFSPELQNNPEALRQALAGDLMHGLNNDPKWLDLKNQFSQFYTPRSKRNIQSQIDSRVKMGEDPKNIQNSINDAWIRGFINPGKGPNGTEEFHSAQDQAMAANRPDLAVWSPEQLNILQQMQDYLATGK